MPTGPPPPPVGLLTDHAPPVRRRHCGRVRYRDLGSVRHRCRRVWLRGSLVDARVHRRSGTLLHRRRNPWERLCQSVGSQGQTRGGRGVPALSRWLGRPVICLRRLAPQACDLLGERRGFGVAGFVRGTGFSQGFSPFRRSFLLTGRCSLLRWACPVKNRRRLGGSRRHLRRRGHWLPGRALLLFRDYLQEALPHRLRQHRLLYPPRRRPWRISCTGHAAWQRRGPVVFCYVAHPPASTTMHASDSATYRKYRFDRNRNGNLLFILYGLYARHLVSVNARRWHRVKGELGSAKRCQDETLLRRSGRLRCASSDGRVLRADPRRTTPAPAPWPGGFRRTGC